MNSNPADWQTCTQCFKWPTSQSVWFIGRRLISRPFIATQLLNVYLPAQCRLLERSTRKQCRTCFASQDTPGLQDRKAVTAWSNSCYSDSRYYDNRTLPSAGSLVRRRGSGRLSSGKLFRSQITICEFQRISDEINVTLIYIFRTQNMLKYNVFIMTHLIHLCRKFHFIWPKLAAPQIGGPVRPHTQNMPKAGTEPL